MRMTESDKRKVIPAEEKVMLNIKKRQNYTDQIKEMTKVKR